MFHNPDLSCYILSFAISSSLSFSSPSLFLFFITIFLPHYSHYFFIISFCIPLSPPFSLHHPYFFFPLFLHTHSLSLPSIMYSEHFRSLLYNSLSCSSLSFFTHTLSLSLSYSVHSCSLQLSLSLSLFSLFLHTHSLTFPLLL